MRVIPFIVSVIVIAACAIPASARTIDFSRDCSDVLKVDVNVRDDLRAGESLAFARNRLQLLASQSALRQTIGEKVSARAEFKLQSHNSNVDERLYNRIRAQAAGFVKHQDIRDVVEVENGREILVLTTRASVCLPKPSFVVKQTVFISSAVNIQGAELPEFHATLSNVFSASSSFIVVDSDEDMADIRISGKISRIEWGDINKTVPRELLQGGAPLNGPSDFQRLSVGAVLEARREDGSVVTTNVNQHRNFPASSNPGMSAPPYVREVLRQGALELHDVVLKSNPGAPAPARAATPGQRSKEW
jgi:hypothetical protein